MKQRPLLILSDAPTASTGLGRITEFWREVVGYEGLYQISDLGRVRRIKPFSRRNQDGIMCRVLFRGYHVVQLSKNKKRKQFMVHSLVAWSFIGPQEKGMEVDHVDGDKLNNSPSNLEYVTKHENLRRRDALGLTQWGERSGTSKLRAEQVVAIRNLSQSGVPYSQLIKRFGTSLANISNIVNRKTWTRI